MKNNPVQIVLNVSDYISIPETNPGGKNTDFYANNDNAFASHKQKILSTAYTIKNTINENPNSSVFAHVTLQSEALAKSHRPIRSIFPTGKVEYVGGGQLGEMLVELNSKNIDAVLSAIEKAETKTTLVEKDGKISPKPSRNKSEVGAISEIRLHQLSDKRNFSIEKAIEWLSDIRTGGVYFIETFFDLNKDTTVSSLSNLEEMALSFDNKLKNLDQRIQVLRSNPEWKDIAFYAIKINEEEIKNEQLHKKIITFFEQQSIVKKIHLSPILENSNSTIEINNEEFFTIPTPNESTYPIVGIIDSGISKTSNLNAWSAGEINFIDDELQDSSHGTFIAGLISAGAALNKNTPQLQETPCKFYDMGLFATDPNEFRKLFPKGFYDFLQQLDFEIPDAKKHGVRIFNMSLSMSLPVEDDSYSFFASVIDEISDNHDVIFVLPAGNLDSAFSRDPWPSTPEDILAMLAKYRHSGKDRILQPCESIRSISVGALEPASEVNALKPSTYTRRGPGPALGIKPDLAQVGGFSKLDAGLYSVNPAGNKVSGCGTSYAAPLVAKSLAILNSSIEGNISREVLISLLIHNANYPKPLNKKELLPIVKDFMGHGIPSATNEIILYDDHSISLVFSGTLKAKQELKFDFTWPASLINEKGGCRGDVALTLAYTPDCSYKYGHEFVRTNIDCYLRQAEIEKETGEIKYKGRLKSETSKIYERSMIENGMKWWPTKKYKGAFKSIGNSSSWRIVVDSLSRAASTLPEEGINFSAILTISDPKKESDIFNEVRRNLISQGISISDIRAAATIRTII
ncbi:MAG: hypothetical protein RL571_2659 [Pseudomonadota bacterium]|jgi:hypothetical protein